MMRQVLSIPDAKHVPKSDEQPSYLAERKNYATKEETVKKALVWIKQYRDEFKDQTARKNWEQEASIADALMRASATANQLNADQANVIDPTKTKSTSASYYRAIKAISSGESAVILGTDKDLPVKYEPIPGCKEYRADEAQMIADYQNALLSHYFEVDKTREKISELDFYVNKYGMMMAEIVWDRREEDRIERVPVYGKWSQLASKLGYGQPKVDHWEFKEKKRIVADNPSLKVYRIDQTWFDATVNDLQDQSCVITRGQAQLGEIYGLQRSGEYVNCQKIGHEDIFNAQEAGTDYVDDYIKANANESDERYGMNTLLDVYRAWVRLPVNDKTGEWDENTQTPHWYLTEWVGDLDGKNTCVRLEPNPNFNKKLPLRLIYALRDDKGAFRMGYSNLVKCYATMEMTTFDFLFDNVRARNRKDWVLERGSIALRDKTFSPAGNKIWWKSPGAENPHELEIQDTTQPCLVALDKIKDYFNETMGTNRPFLGEPLGGRATASEVNAVFEQALKPALEEAKFKANQILPFVAEWFMEMSREYSDPETTIVIVKEPEPIQIKPTELWGPLNIRVTSVKAFQDGILRRREEDQFINQIFPLIKPLMSVQGQINFFAQVARNRGFEGVDHWWVKEQDFDAKRVARSENDAILFQGMNLLPSPEENHEIHLQEHKMILASYTTLPADQQVPENVQKMKMMIQMHEQFKQQAAQGEAAAKRSPVMEENPPNLVGEAQGEMMAAEGGEDSNMPPVA